MGISVKNLADRGKLDSNLICRIFSPIAKIVFNYLTTEFWIFFRNGVPIRFSLVPYEERRLVALMPPVSESFQRMREYSEIESALERIKLELKLLGPQINETEFQTKTLMSQKAHYENQRRATGAASTDNQKQILHMQRAASLVAARNSGTSGQDQPGILRNDKMRAFLM